MSNRSARPKRTRAETRQFQEGGREKTLIPMGRLGAAHGLKGWLRVASYAEPPEQLRNYRDWVLVMNGQRQEIALRSMRVTCRGLVCQLEGVDTREAAEALRGAEICINRGSLPPTKTDEWYWADLEGLEVRNIQGENLGDVAGLMATGANDVLIVEGERRRLIPFLPGSHVLEVNPREGRLIVDWDASF